MVNRDGTDWNALRAVAMGWLDTGLTRVRHERRDASSADLLYFKVAEYLLLSAREYTETAFEALMASRYHSGISCTRTVFEMAIILRWCFRSPAEQRERLKRWAKTSMADRQRVLRVWQDTHPEQYGKALAEAEARLQAAIDDLGDIKELPPSGQIATDLENDHHSPEDVRFVWTALYKQQCQSTHAQLAPERFFEAVGPAEVCHATPRCPPYAEWMALSSVLWLVCTVYRMLSWDVAPLVTAYHEALSDDE